jgi:hypothetical protein
VRDAAGTVVLEQRDGLAGRDDDEVEVAAAPSHDDDRRLRAPVDVKSVRNGMPRERMVGHRGGYEPF